MRAGPVCGGGGLRTRWPERIGNDQMAGEESSHLDLAHLKRTPHRYTHSNNPYQTRKPLRGNAHMLVRGGAELEIRPNLPLPRPQEEIKA